MPNFQKSLFQLSSLPPSANWDENYAKWKKVDLIEDLVYFRDRDRENQKLILQMKDAWKEDEQEKDFYHRETIRLKNEAISAEKILRNEHEIEITELCRKIKAIKASNSAKDETEYKRLQQTYKSVVKENLKLTTGRF